MFAVNDVNSTGIGVVISALLLKSETESALKA